MSKLVVDVQVQSDKWQSFVEKKSIDAKQIFTTVYNEFDGVDAEVSLVLCDDAFITGLNKKYRDKNKATNVLSFPASDGFALDGMVEPLGDIVVAYETVLCECMEQEKSFENHFTHLLIHGMLHLLGFDHVTSDEAKEMESLEVDFLHNLGINNPYMETEVIEYI